MWRRWTAMAALLVVLLAPSQRVYGLEHDEFDLPEEPAKPKVQPRMALPSHYTYPTGKQSYPIEITAASICVLYALFYFIGRSRNRKVSQEWLEQSEPHLVEQFSYTSASAQPPVGLTEESPDVFKYYCTGRRFCSRMVISLELATRQDLLAQLVYLVKPATDYMVIDVGMNPDTMDPMIFCLSKKLQFIGLSKKFPELISVGKQISCDLVPSSFWVATDCLEIPKFVIEGRIKQLFEQLEPFIEFIVFTDLNSTTTSGIPLSQKHLLRLKLKLSSGKDQLDYKKCWELTMALIDGIGSTFKLSRDGKRICENKRKHLKENEEEAQKKLEEVQLRQLKLKQKKKEEYSQLSYEEQQKRDELQQKKLARKRTKVVKK